MLERLCVMVRKNCNLRHILHLVIEIAAAFG